MSTSENNNANQLFESFQNMKAIAPKDAEAFSCQGMKDLIPQAPIQNNSTPLLVTPVKPS